MKVRLLVGTILPIVISVLVISFMAIIGSLFVGDNGTSENGFMGYLYVTVLMMFTAIIAIGPQSIMYSIFQEFVAIPISKHLDSRLAYIGLGGLFGFLCGATIDFSPYKAHEVFFLLLGLGTGVSASVVLGMCGAFKSITENS